MVGSQQVAVGSQQVAVGAQSVASGHTPIVVQKPKVVTVSLKPTPAPVVPQESVPASVVDEVEAMSDVVVNQEVKQRSFTNDELLQAWRMYAKKIEGELHTFNTMMNFLPERNGETSIIVKLINTMQLDALSRHKRTLEMFLANELGNSGIVVNFLVEEQVARPMFFTADEKFKHMQEINPDFKLLKSELGLEIV